MKISVPVTIDIDVDEWARYEMNNPDATVTEVRARCPGVRGEPPGGAVGGDRYLHRPSAKVSAYGSRVVRDADAGVTIRHGDFSWSLDPQKRHEVNIFGDGQRIVLSNDGWRALRNLLNALADIEASDPSL